MSLVTAINAEYKDLDLRLKTHPNHGDIVPVRDVAAVRNSIKNILNTRPGERPFNPNFGTNLHELLFEPNDSITRYMIEKTIRQSLEEFEPRFRLIEINISDDPDNNAYNIFLNGIIVNTQREIELNLLIKRFS